MGNIECWRQKTDIYSIEYKEEIFIREILENYTTKMVGNAKLIKLMQKCFSIILLDIEGPPLDWISEDTYYEFIYRIFDKSGKSQEKELKYIILEYNKVRKITLKLVFI